MLSSLTSTNISRLVTQHRAKPGKDFGPYLVLLCPTNDAQQLVPSGLAGLICGVLDRKEEHGLPELRLINPCGYTGLWSVDESPYNRERQFKLLDEIGGWKRPGESDPYSLSITLFGPPEGSAFSYHKPRRGCGWTQKDADGVFLEDLGYMAEGLPDIVLTLIDQESFSRLLNDENAPNEGYIFVDGKDGTIRFGGYD